MGRLDSLDLSLKLSREEEAERLEAGHERLAALRLALGGKLGDGELGPPVCVLFEGWDASGQGRGHQAPRRAARPAPRARGAVRGAHPRREAPPLPLALLAGAPRLGRHGRARPLLVRARAGGAAWRASRPSTSGSARTTRSWSFERSLALEGMILIKFWIHISEDEQLKRFKKRESDPLKSWKLTDEDWRNREKRAGLRAGRGGHARPHRPRARPLAARSRATRSAGRA